MCGIWAFLSTQPLTPERKEKLEKIFQAMVHRGPNAFRFNQYHPQIICAFHRLAIVDPTMAGMGPFDYKDMVCTANAEIYNYEKLEVDLKSKIKDLTFKSRCDTEVILPFFDFLGRDIEALCQQLDGEYAFVIYDGSRHCCYVATDEISIRPVFIGVAEDGVVISSELCALRGICSRVERLPAGHYCVIPCNNPTSSAFTFKSFYSFEKPLLNITFEEAKNKIREIFIQNVRDKIHYGTRNDGFFLSGGLDSSLVAGIAAKLRAPKKLNTFTVGFSPNATDVIYARKVAEFIGSNHHEIIVKEEDGIEKLEEIIKFLGTFDQTTIRASTPLYLATQWIKQKYPDIYIMYNGELADELQGGYLYFRKAPSPAAHRAESIRRLSAVHNYDGLRCDRVCAAFSIEARFPFFSKSLLDFVLSLPPEYLDPNTHSGTEKFLIRDAFRGCGYIPEEVLWRTKNALSDATSVKSSWKEKLKAHVESHVTDIEFSDSRKKWTHVPPDTKEDYYYRRIFDKYYVGFENTIPYKWLPLWCGDVTDSSASVLSVFNETDPNHTVV